MALRQSLLLQRGGPNPTTDTLEQDLLFRVFPAGEETKAVTLFRIRAKPSTVRHGKLSGFIADVILSMHPHWDTVQDVEKLRTRDRNARPTLRPTLEVTGTDSEKRNRTPKMVTTKMTLPDDHMPYKATDMQGAFCYDTTTNASKPLTLANVTMMIRAIKNQIGNPNTTGQEGDGNNPRILWIPGGVDPTPEEEEYERNLKVFESWAATDKNPGKVVYWQYEEAPTTIRR